VKRCLDVIKKTTERNMRAQELTNRRLILEEWSDYLAKMRWGVEPVRSVQKELKFENVEHLCRAVSGLGFSPLDPNKCEVVIPSVIVKERTVVMITLKDKNNNPVTDSSEELNVFLKEVRSGKVIQVTPIKEVGGGMYEAPFTAIRCGYYMISITVDGHHIAGSPHE